MHFVADLRSTVMVVANGCFHRAAGGEFLRQHIPSRSCVPVIFFCSCWVVRVGLHNFVFHGFFDFVSLVLQIFRFA
jgi:hypothetical protein